MPSSLYRALRRLRGGELPSWDALAHARARDFTDEAAESFRRLGLGGRRPFVPHRAFHLPCAGPDAGFLARALCGIRSPESLWLVVLSARGPVLDEFPPDLWFDDELVWHRQQFGQPGHLAYACLALRGDTVFGLAYVSDVVQRIGRRREYRTRIENRFRAWPELVLNSVMDFALERGARRVCSPTADTVLAHADPTRTPGRSLFERVYDRAVRRQYAVARRTTRRGIWWEIDVDAHRDRIVRPAPVRVALGSGTTICVCHDIERELGHRTEEPSFAAAIRPRAPGLLDRMLEVERAAGVRATHAVVGRLLAEVGPAIAAEGHTLAFHGFDHRRRGRQLASCRALDPRIAGYRPPQSRLTLETRDGNLVRHDIRWLALEAGALGASSPFLERRVVKIPVHLDDHPLHRGETTYAEWEERLLSLVGRQPFVAFGLHDCYADHWLPHYPALLARLREMGTLHTLDEVATRAGLAHAV